MLFEKMRQTKDRQAEGSAKDSVFLPGLRPRLSLVSCGSTLSLVAAFVGTWYYPDIYQHQFTVVALCLGALLFFRSLQWFRPSLSCFLLYLWCSCFWRLSDTSSTLTPAVSAMLSVIELRALAFVAISIAVSLVLKDGLRRILPFLVPLLAISSLLGLPLLTNQSTNAALLTTILPLSSNPLTWALTFIVVMTQAGTTAVAILAVVGLMAAVRAIAAAVDSAAARAAAIKLTPVGLLGAALFLWRALTVPSFFYGTDRFEMYKKTWDFFVDSDNHALGFGVGSFQLLGIIIQGDTSSGLWMSLHSDWLQGLFEIGIIGMGLAIWVLIECFCRADYKERMVFVALSIFALFYFPLSIPLVQFLTIYLVVLNQWKHPSISNQQ